MLVIAWLPTLAIIMILFAEAIDCLRLARVTVKKTAEKISEKIAICL